MKRSVTFLIAVLAVVVAVPTFAAQQTATVNVTATVNTVCTITANPVAFGVYDPVVTNATAGAGDKFANGSVVVACTKNAPNVFIELNAGNNSGSAVGTTRAMAGGGDFLSYELYKANPNPGPAAVWSTGQGTGAVSYAPASKAATTITVFGKLPGGQDVAAAPLYSDQVTATINY